jgi:hypothetical protein
MSDEKPVTDTASFDFLIDKLSLFNYVAGRQWGIN